MSGAQDWVGRSLGEQQVAYQEQDAILYALAVGARAAELDLVLEDRLRVLPTFALTLAQWAPDALGEAGAFDPTTAVHGAQRLQVLAPLPRSGLLTMSASVTAVWDKGSAAIFEVGVRSEQFLATWAIFAPGLGGFGGERGPAAPTVPTSEPGARLVVRTHPEQAALYRLLGDRHLMHIDPDAARAAGQPRPFLHGLCSLAAVTLEVARTTGAHPADLVELRGRFAAPVFPGEELAVDTWSTPEGTVLEATAAGRRVLTGAAVRFAQA